MKKKHFWLIEAILKSFGQYFKKKPIYICGCYYECVFPEHHASKISKIRTIYSYTIKEGIKTLYSMEIGKGLDVCAKC